ncbi:hypothetical protein NPIL_687091 [Nephila pilipes]|uniref:Secreted protein n=1 Tax=Nephila pilipes TaxID=299642 RepID=A0A8X6IBG4_NEPPI|nr:hypothetical protein NPIL_389461 [Nephila pilipes]GFS98325.1 hypothetical protein NPIL_393231 [Nephila pilipes]GFT87198.1 hypothetical protein NPIL_313371 [Nephila pilipes]GFU41385.1 hypothetical protein NPIL_687091 [Nephila pilipes]
MPHFRVMWLSLVPFVIHLLRSCPRVLPDGCHSLHNGMTRQKTPDHVIPRSITFYPDTLSKEFCALDSMESFLKDTINVDPWFSFG